VVIASLRLVVVAAVSVVGDAGFIFELFGDLYAAGVDKWPSGVRFLGRVSSPLSKRQSSASFVTDHEKPSNYPSVFCACKSSDLKAFFAAGLIPI